MARKITVKEGRNMIHIVIDRDLKQELAEEARSKGMDLNTYIRFILIERNK